MLRFTTWILQTFSPPHNDKLSCECEQVLPDCDWDTTMCPIH